jgi:hypothetical protein
MSKLITLPEAISRFVPEGSSVALGLALEGLIPFAAGHAIIRQRVRDLTHRPHLRHPLRSDHRGRVRAQGGRRSDQND